MNCCQCQAIEEQTTQKYVGKDLARYLAKGPGRATRLLIGAIREAGVDGLTVLDIGGGVGAIQHALLEAGAEHVTGVEAASAYIRVAQAEAQRRNMAAQVSYLHGDFVELAAAIMPADVVTLDKVICCYPDVEKLVELSSARARKLYGLVYPRDAWWSRAVEHLMNLIYRIQRNPFRIFVHRNQVVEGILAGHGFTLQFYRRTSLWQVAVYSR